MNATESPGPRARGRSRQSRHDLIVRNVNSEGYVHVDALADALSVSRMTIHRDLDALQEAGRLRKVRGGATAEPSTQFEREMSYRANAFVQQKHSIARAAAEFVNDGDVVLMGDSTTALHAFDHMQQLSQITLITNYLPAMEKAKELKNVRVIGLGGEYSPHYAAFMGMVCLDSLSRLHADVLIASTSSIVGTTLYHQDPRVTQVKRAMIKASALSILLMDSSKFGSAALHQVCDVREFDAVVVNSGVQESDIRQIESAGVQVVVAGGATRHNEEVHS